MPPASARQVMRSPERRDRVTPSDEPFSRGPGKVPFEKVAGRASYENVRGRTPYGVTPSESLERAGPYGEQHRTDSYGQAFRMKLNDRKHLGNVGESVIKKTPHNTPSELSTYKKIPELRPIRETNESEAEEKQSHDRTLKNVSENGHLEPTKKDTVGQRMPDMNRHAKDGTQRAATFKGGWTDLQLDSVTPGSFLQELNDVGPPSTASIEKPAPDKNTRLPFTSMLRGMSPSPGGPTESRSQFLNLDAATRERMRENMMASNYLHSSDEKHERFNPARGGDMSAYMYGSKRPPDMMPPLQYRPNLSAMSHQRNMDSPDIPSGGNSQFVDLNSVHYRGFPSGLPGSREPMSREQMYYLEQQRRQQLAAASSMDAMMVGGPPDRMMSYGGMLRQQELFNAAYASHMRNGEFQGFPSEGERQA